MIWDLNYIGKVFSQKLLDACLIEQAGEGCQDFSATSELQPPHGPEPWTLSWAPTPRSWHGGSS